MEKIIKKTISIFILTLTTVSVVGSLIYRFYSLNYFGVFLSILLSAIVLFIILFIAKNGNKTTTDVKSKNDIVNPSSKQPIFKNIVVIFYLSLLASLFFILYHSQTSKSVISPWEVIPSYFFLIYIGATLLLFAIIYYCRSLSLLFISLHCFLSFIIAVIVYQLGFGYDTFVHAATLQFIDQHGLIEPKTFYYLSFYAPLIIIHKLFFPPLIWLNKLLVPFLAALLLPSAFYFSCRSYFADQQKLIAAILLLLIIPFSVFTLSTPQNLAYLFLLLAIAISLDNKNNQRLVLIYLLALAALLAQPLAGLPAIFFAILITVDQLTNKKLRITLQAGLYILVAISLPLALLVFEKTTDSTAVNTITPDGLSRALALPGIAIPGQDNFIFNFIYLYGFNTGLTIFLFALVGIVIAKKYWSAFSHFFLFLGMCIALVVAYLLSAALPFNFIIGYEKSEFLDRILITAVLFLLPFILLVFYSLINKLATQNKIIQVSFIIFLALLISTALYLSYPRFDRIYSSRGYSTGQSDIAAVRWIEQDAHGQNYIVLADQQVSAAALSQFGFKQYYDDNIFYYPIPTSSPLYQYYLDMVYQQPNRATMEAAMNLVNV